MGERILVVGGTRGTGRLIAERLLEDGYEVRVLARDPERAAAELDDKVEVTPGDLTVPATLTPGVRDVDHIVFTAGVHSGRYAPESLVKATDHDGVIATLAAASREGFRGRFLYLNSIGIDTPSLASSMMNLLKRNTLRWRRRVEVAIRSSGIDYTIIRVGFLLNRPAGRRAIRLGQTKLPLAPRYRIARADVAEGFVAGLKHPRASRATFEIVWGKGEPKESWERLLDRVRPDTSRPAP
jgi:uncharacterized protein YbjT (DUF2867 family)